jgi:hypothetical protein
MDTTEAREDAKRILGRFVLMMLLSPVMLVVRGARFRPGVLAQHERRIVHAGISLPGRR